VPVVVLLAFGIGVTHLSNIRRLMSGEESQVVRPVRWGRPSTGAPDPDALISQGPSGAPASSGVWRDPVPDPLDPTG